jgi:3-oxoadipate enol-lactonase
LSIEEDLPIVLLHGTSGESEDWSRVVEQLAKHRSVIRPNYVEPITGSGPANGLAISDLAARVVAAANADDRRRFDLAGYSLGAAVATFVAAEYPEMVRSLVLVSGFSYGGDPRMKLQFDVWLRLARTDKVALTKLLLATGLTREFLATFDESTLDGIIEGFVASSNWPVIEQAIRVDLSVDVREQARKISAKTLLITAKYDQIVPPVYSEDLSVLIPGAKRFEIHSGHLSFLEKPLELASALLSLSDAYWTISSWLIWVPEGDDSFDLSRGQSARHRHLYCGHRGKKL